MNNPVQRWPKKFVLGCVISPLCQQAQSRNLGHTFLANSVSLPIRSVSGEGGQVPGFGTDGADGGGAAPGRGGRRHQASLQIVLGANFRFIGIM